MDENLKKGIAGDIPTAKQAFNNTMEVKMPQPVTQYDGGINYESSNLSQTKPVSTPSAPTTATAPINEPPSMMSKAGNYVKAQAPELLSKGANAAKKIVNGLYSPTGLAISTGLGTVESVNTSQAGLDKKYGTNLSGSEPTVSNAIQEAGVRSADVANNIAKYSTLGLVDPSSIGRGIGDALFNLTNPSLAQQEKMVTGSTAPNPNIVPMSSYEQALKVRDQQPVPNQQKATEQPQQSANGIDSKTRDFMDKYASPAKKETIKASIVQPPSNTDGGNGAGTYSGLTGGTFSVLSGNQPAQQSQAPQDNGGLIAIRPDMTAAEFDAASIANKANRRNMQAVSSNANARNNDLRLALQTGIENRALQHQQFIQRMEAEKLARQQEYDKLPMQLRDAGIRQDIAKTMEYQKVIDARTKYGPDSAQAAAAIKAYGKMYPEKAKYDVKTFGAPGMEKVIINNENKPDFTIIDPNTQTSSSAPSGYQTNAKGEIRPKQ